MELIKRENKLWTNDSLFLREVLHIPITPDNSHLITDEWDILSADEARSRSGSEVGHSGEQGQGQSQNWGHSNSNKQLDTLGDRGSDKIFDKSLDNHNGASGNVGDMGSESGSKVKGRVDNQGGDSEKPGTGMDFFSKYDSSIALLKSKVESLERNSR